LLERAVFSGRRRALTCKQALKKQNFP